MSVKRAPKRKKSVVNMDRGKKDPTNSAEVTDKTDNMMEATKREETSTTTTVRTVLTSSVTTKVARAEITNKGAISLLVSIMSASTKPRSTWTQTIESIIAMTQNFSWRWCQLKAVLINLRCMHSQAASTVAHRNQIQPRLESIKSLLLAKSLRNTRPPTLNSI